MVGYASDQALSRVKQLGPSLQPDIVVFGIFIDYRYGDLPRLIAHRKFGLYRIYEGYLIPPSTWDALQQGGLSSLIQKINIFFRAHSHLIDMCFKTYKKIFPGQEFYVDVSGSDPKQARQLLDGFFDLLHQGVAACQEIGADPVFVLIPSLSHLIESTPFTREADQQIELFLKEINVPYLNLASLFQARIHALETLYFPDNHLSPLGHKQAAEALVPIFDRLIKKRS